MFELLFSISPEQFAQGTLLIDGSWARYFGIVALIAVGASGLLAFRGIGIFLRWRDRILLWLVRTVWFSLLAFLLLNPVWVVETQEPIPGEVAVLLDNSLSMRIADQDAGTRADFINRNFVPGGAVAQTLDQDFRTRYWTFDGSIAPLSDSLPSFNGSRSDIAAALDQLLRERGNRALASIVLVSDGGMHRTSNLEPVLQRLHAAGIAVHTVAIGSDRFASDLEVSGLQLPEAILQGDTIDAQVLIRQQGLSNQPITLTVEEDDAIVARQTITPQQDQERISVHIPLTFAVAGPRRLTVRTTANKAELITDNNVVERMIQVDDGELSVLHFEGEPRFEVKFLRRAVAEDEHIRLVSLVRTAENKYYRLGIKDSDELAGGFPQTEEALFAFDALVIGSADANLLSAEDQARIRAFVARRGGGLLLLGGSGAFAEGGFSSMPLSELMPVLPARQASNFRAEVQVRLSTAGQSDPLLRFDASANRITPWQDLPPLTVINPIRQAKPGASVLLEADDGGGDPLVILAYQRYGRGTVAAFPVRDTWRWQMHASIPVDDQIHETLWRRLLRALARPAAKRLQVQTEPSEAALGQAVTVTAEVFDKLYRPRTDAQPTLTLTSPLGDIETLPLTPTTAGDGQYKTQFIARETGYYELRVTQDEGAENPLQFTTQLRVDSAGQEFFAAERNTAVLSRIAGRTGGRLFTANEIDALPEAIDDTRDTRSIIRRIELWDAPIFLLLLLALAGFEWFYRRRCTLA